MKSITLSIPNPCAEKWANLTTTATGGHCGTCNKVVVDFISMSDDEVLTYFKHNRGHTCGRFQPKQLKMYNYHQTIHVRPGMLLLKAGMMGLLFACVSKQSFAQQKVEKVKTEFNDASQIKDSQAKADDGQIIKGIVMARGEEDPLPGVNVILQGTEVGTNTDANGRFEFPQKLKQGDVLVFYFIGMDANEYKVGKDTGPIVEIKMMCDYSIMGELMIDSTAMPEPTKLQRVVQKLKAGW